MYNAFASNWAMNVRMKVRSVSAAACCLILGVAALSSAATHTNVWFSVGIAGVNTALLIVTLMSPSGYLARVACACGVVLSLVALMIVLL